MIILDGKRHVFLFPPCVLHGFVHPGEILRHLRWMQEQTSGLTTKPAAFLPSGSNVSGSRLACIESVICAAQGSLAALTPHRPAQGPAHVPSRREWPRRRWPGGAHGSSGPYRSLAGSTRPSAMATSASTTHASSACAPMIAHARTHSRSHSRTQLSSARLTQPTILALPLTTAKKSPGSGRIVWALC